MKCFYHHEQEAVTTCNNCHKGLCQTCTISMPQGSFCPDCFADIIKYQEKLLSSLRWRIGFFILFAIAGMCYIAYRYFAFPNYQDAVSTIITYCIIGSIPLSFYYMKGTPDPYVPTSLKSLGILMIFNLVVKCVLGPIFVVKAIYDYFNIKKVKDYNEGYLLNTKTMMQSCKN